MSREALRPLLQALRFTEGSDRWTKTYPLHGAIIAVDFVRNRIVYPGTIERGDETTTHFEAEENFVVLECVDRLLTKGYRPESLVLELRHKLGRTGKSGKSDITVLDRTGKPLLVIECKTWGVEYEAEQEQMRLDGGQLFSYFKQDRNPRYLCLYASRVPPGGGEAEYGNGILCVEDSAAERAAQSRKPDELLTYASAKNTLDLVAVWQRKAQKQFASKGIFEEGFEAYNPGFEPRRIRDLKEFARDDRGRVFNAFEEILRHNNISDRSNAFNRFISLVLAKIVDEARPADQIADFQVKTGLDDPESLHERLQTLYSKAMRDYLREEVVNYTLEDIEGIIAGFPRQTAQDELRRIYRELKFYSNNEFAFKEVYNKPLFEANGQVLDEIVRLFEPYRFRYNRRAQFLGEFFELMLESGYKQSEGQFFTPTPIARFLVSSLPIERIIREKASRDEPFVLPRLVDYACGSGHFLTEAIEEIQHVLGALPDAVHPSLAAARPHTDWAAECICGIEKDYRLARTSQVACFMHGDGKARIIFGDGLERHDGRLPAPQFDLLVANPPYTIKDFKKHLRRDRLPDFELFETISEDSDDIEVLFVERAAQLVRPGGYAALILPSSILNNAGVYTRARDRLLRAFRLRAVVEFGGGTFAATGTNTVALFMQRRPDRESEDFRFIAADFLLGNQPRPADWCDSLALWRGYCAHRSLDFEEYRRFAAREPSAEFRATDFFAACERRFERGPELRELEKKRAFQRLTDDERAARRETLFFDLALEAEADKFHCWMLVHDQPLLVVRAGRDKDAEREFLGYKFSDRRGYKGIEILARAGQPLTKLYDADAPENPEKVNAHVRRALLGEVPGPVPAALAEHVGHLRLVDCLNFEQADFEKQISLSAPSAAAGASAARASRWPLVPLGEVSRILSGGTPSTRVSEYWDGGIAWATLVDTKQKYLRATQRTISAAGLKDSNALLLPVDTVIFSSRATIGDVCIAKLDVCTNQGYKNFVCDRARLEPEYLYYVLKNNVPELKKLAAGMTYPEISKEKFESYRIPLPPLGIQQEIVTELQECEAELQRTDLEIEELRRTISATLAALPARRRVEEVCETSGDRSDPNEGEPAPLAYVGLEHIEGGTGRLAADWKPAQAGAVKSLNFVFRQGEVLYGKLRPYLNKVWRAEFDGVCSTELLVLRAAQPHLLKWSLLDEAFVAQTRERMRGNNLPRLRPEEFRALTIPWPAPPGAGAAESAVAELDGRWRELAARAASLASRGTDILRLHLE